MKNKLIFISILASLNLAYSALIFANTMQDAEQAIAKKDYSTAIIHLKNQLKATPKDAQARFLLGSVYLHTGKLNSSLKELGRAHDLEPNNTDMLFRYAEILQASAKNKKLLTVLKKPLTDKQEEIKRLSYLGNAHLALRHLADAKALFEQANTIQPNPMAFNGLANLAVMEQDLPLASQLIDKALTIDKDNSAALQSKAKLANINQQSENALIIYNQLVKKSPNDLSLRLQRATTLAILKDNSAAMADLKLILQRVKDHPQANFIKAQILLSQKDYKGAQEAAQRVVNVRPKHMPAAFILGAANFALQQYNQAEEYLTIYCSTNPGNLKAQNLLANVYLAQNKPRQSILILEGIATDKLHKSPLLLMTLGSSYIQQGDNKKGIELLTKAQSLAPDNQDISKRLIAVQFNTGDFNDAINELEQLAAQQNSDGQIQTNYLLVISYIKQKDYQSANNKIQQLLQQSPDDSKLLNLKALVAQLQGNSAEAINQYNNIIKKDPQDIPAHMGLARVYALQADWTEAQKNFQQVIKIKPKTLKAHLGLAAIAEKQGHADIAEQHFLDALELSKDNISSTLTIAGLLSQWYELKNQPEKVLSLAEKLDQQHANNTAIRSFLARAQLLNKQQERSERTLKSIITFDKKDIKHRILLARIIAQDSDRLAEALPLVDDALAIEADNFALYTFKSHLLVRQGKYSAAINVAKEMQEKFPDSNTGKLLEADINRSQKDYQQALSIYQSVYKKQPDKKIFSAIIDMLLILKQSDQAIQLLSKAVSQQPNEINNLFKLASLYHEKNQLPQAEKYYLKILTLNPKHIVTLNNLAWIKQDSDIKEALRLAQSAHEYAPESAAIMDSYGYFLLLNGQYEQSLKLLKQAAEKRPDDKDIQYHLALSYHKKNQLQKARDILAKIINSDDDYMEKEKARQLYQRIK